MNTRFDLFEPQKKDLSISSSLKVFEKIGILKDFDNHGIYTCFDKLQERKSRGAFKEGMFLFKDAITGEETIRPLTFTDERIKVDQIGSDEQLDIPRFIYHGTKKDFDPKNITPSDKDGVIWLTFDEQYAANYIVPKSETEKTGKIYCYDLAKEDCPIKIKTVFVSKTLNHRTPYENKEELCELANSNVDAVFNILTGDIIYIGHLKGKG